MKAVEGLVKYICCISATLWFLFNGRDGGGSDVGWIVMMVVVVLALYSW